MANYFNLTRTRKFLSREIALVLVFGMIASSDAVYSAARNFKNVFLENTTIEDVKDEITDGDEILDGINVDDENLDAEESLTSHGRIRNENIDDENEISGGDNEITDNDENENNRMHGDHNEISSGNNNDEADPENFGPAVDDENKNRNKKATDSEIEDEDEDNSDIEEEPEYEDIATDSEIDFDEINDIEENDIATDSEINDENLTQDENNDAFDVATDSEISEVDLINNEIDTESIATTSEINIASTSEVEELIIEIATMSELSLLGAGMSVYDYPKTEGVISGTAKINDALKSLTNPDNVWYIKPQYTTFTDGVSLISDPEDSGYGWDMNLARARYVSSEHTIYYYIIPGEWNVSCYNDEWACFDGFKNLKSIDLNYNLVKVLEDSDVSWEGMFKGCVNLESVNILSEAHKVTINTPKSAFEGCEKLKAINCNSILDIYGSYPKYDVSNMFKDCKSLETLPRIYFENCKNTENMFYNCKNLKKIDVYIPKNTSLTFSLSTNMFYGCENLVGGAGTKYNSSYVDGNMARYDIKPNKYGDSECGYFTGIQFGTAEDYELTDDTTTLMTGKEINTIIKKMINEGYQQTIDYNTVLDPVNDAYRKLVYKQHINNIKIYDGDIDEYPLGCHYGASSLISKGDKDAARVWLKMTKYGSTWETNYDQGFEFDIMYYIAPGVKIPSDLSYMFNNLDNIQTIEISPYLDTSNVTDTSNMFAGCTNLKTVYAYEFNKDKITNSSNMFKNATKIVGGKGTKWSSSYIDKTRADIDGGTSKPGYFTQLPRVPKIKVDNYVVKDDTTTLLKGTDFSIQLHRLVNPSIGSPYDDTTVKYIKLSDVVFNEGVSLVSTGDQMAARARYDSSTKTIYYYIAPKVKMQAKMTYLFRRFKAAEQIEVSKNFDFKEPTDISYMFAYCNALTSLDLSHFDTSNVNNMSYMFYYCNALTSLDLSHFDTSNVTDMSSMFRNCSALASLDLTCFDTSNVTKMSGMFYECKNLSTLDISSFDVSNVAKMDYMFYGCANLSLLDLACFDTKNLTSTEYMFSDCTKLTTIKATKSFNISSILTHSFMFNNCPLLVGGAGTTWASTKKTGKTYARIDEGETKPGYFTLGYVIKINIDTDDDGIPDLNIDKDGDGFPDINIDTNEDKKPDTNVVRPVEFDEDGCATSEAIWQKVGKDDEGHPNFGDTRTNPITYSKAETQVPTGRAAENAGKIQISVNGEMVEFTTTRGGVLSFDEYKNKYKEHIMPLNYDMDDDGFPDLNIDMDGDGIPDIDVDKNGDGIPEKEIVEGTELNIKFYEFVSIGDDTYRIEDTQNFTYDKPISTILDANKNKVKKVITEKLPKLDFDSYEDKLYKEAIYRVDIKNAKDTVWSKTVGILGDKIDGNYGEFIYDTNISTQGAKVDAVISIYISIASDKDISDIENKDKDDIGKEGTETEGGETLDPSPIDVPTDITIPRIPEDDENPNEPKKPQTDVTEAEKNLEDTKEIIVRLAYFGLDLKPVEYKTVIVDKASIKKGAGIYTYEVSDLSKIATEIDLPNDAIVYGTGTSIKNAMRLDAPMFVNGKSVEVDLTEKISTIYTFVTTPYTNKYDMNITYGTYEGAQFNLDKNYNGVIDDLEHRGLIANRKATKEDVEAAIANGTVHMLYNIDADFEAGGMPKTNVRLVDKDGKQIAFLNVTTQNNSEIPIINIDADYDGVIDSFLNVLPDDNEEKEKTTYEKGKAPAITDIKDRYKTNWWTESRVGKYGIGFNAVDPDGIVRWHSFAPDGVYGGFVGGFDENGEFIIDSKYANESIYCSVNQTIDDRGNAVVNIDVDDDGNPDYNVLFDRVDLVHDTKNDTYKYVAHMLPKMMNVLDLDEDGYLTTRSSLAPFIEYFGDFYKEVLPLRDGELSEKEPVINITNDYNLPVLNVAENRLTLDTNGLSDNKIIDTKSRLIELNVDNVKKVVWAEDEIKEWGKMIYTRNLDMNLDTVPDILVDTDFDYVADANLINEEIEGQTIARNIDLDGDNKPELNVTLYNIPISVDDLIRQAEEEKLGLLTAKGATEGEEEKLLNADDFDLSIYNIDFKETGRKALENGANINELFTASGEPMLVNYVSDFSDPDIYVMNRVDKGQGIGFDYKVKNSTLGEELPLVDIKAGDKDYNVTENGLNPVANVLAVADDGKTVVEYDNVGGAMLNPKNITVNVVNNVNEIIARGATMDDLDSEKGIYLYNTDGNLQIKGYIKGDNSGAMVPVKLADGTFLTDFAEKGTKLYKGDKYNVSNAKYSVEFVDNNSHKGTTKIYLLDSLYKILSIEDYVDDNTLLSRDSVSGTKYFTDYDLTGAKVVDVPEKDRRQYALNQLGNDYYYATKYISTKDGEIYFDPSQMVMTNDGKVVLSKVVNNEKQYVTVKKFYDAVKKQNVYADYYYMVDIHYSAEEEKPVTIYCQSDGTVIGIEPTVFDGKKIELKSNIPGVKFLVNGVEQNYIMAPDTYAYYWLDDGETVVVANEAEILAKGYTRIKWSTEPNSKGPNLTNMTAYNFVDTAYLIYEEKGTATATSDAITAHITFKQTGLPEEQKAEFKGGTAEVTIYPRESTVDSSLKITYEKLLNPHADNVTDYKLTKWQLKEITKEKANGAEEETGATVSPTRRNDYEKDANQFIEDTKYFDYQGTPEIDEFGNMSVYFEAIATYEYSAYKMINMSIGSGYILDKEIADKEDFEYRYIENATEFNDFEQPGATRFSRLNQEKERYINLNEMLLNLLGGSKLESNDVRYSFRKCIAINDSTGEILSLEGQTPYTNMSITVYPIYEKNETINVYVADKYLGNEDGYHVELSNNISKYVVRNELIVKSDDENKPTGRKYEITKNDKLTVNDFSMYFNSNNAYMLCGKDGNNIIPFDGSETLYDGMIIYPKTESSFMKVTFDTSAIDGNLTFELSDYAKANHVEFKKVENESSNTGGIHRGGGTAGSDIVYVPGQGQVEVSNKGSVDAPRLMLSQATDESDKIKTLYFNYDAELYVYDLGIKNIGNDGKEQDVYLKLTENGKEHFLQRNDYIADGDVIYASEDMYQFGPNAITINIVDDQKFQAVPSDLKEPFHLKNDLYINSRYVKLHNYNYIRTKRKDDYTYELKIDMNGNFSSVVNDISLGYDDQSFSGFTNKNGGNVSEYYLTDGMTIYIKHGKYKLSCIKNGKRYDPIVRHYKTYNTYDTYKFDENVYLSPNSYNPQLVKISDNHMISHITYVYPDGREMSPPGMTCFKSDKIKMTKIANLKEEEYYNIDYTGLIKNTNYVDTCIYFSYQSMKLIRMISGQWYGGDWSLSTSAYDSTLFIKWDYGYDSKKPYKYFYKSSIKPTQTQYFSGVLRAYTDNFYEPFGKPIDWKLMK